MAQSGAVLLTLQDSKSSFASILTYSTGDRQIEAHKLYSITFFLL
ncbi:hypothetical protein [uncultured Thermosynechococcus sp.]|nr:hypothetical protein [uncultured Thermosynechococcus sp.]